MTPSHEARARRHYFEVDVAAWPEGFGVALDGRPVLTDAGGRLVMPTEALAALVADEWLDQGEFIAFETMPATRMARAAGDALPGGRADLADRIAAWAGNDLICYFAEAPPELARRQQASWTPVLAWAEARFGHPVARAVGIVHRAQSPALIGAVRQAALTLADSDLAGLAAAGQLFGSAFLAFALREGRLSAGESFAASRLDETFQAETWGVDAEAETRAATLAAEAAMLARWFAALR